MRRLILTRRLATAAFAAATLAGCGGGAGNSTPNSGGSGPSNPSGAIQTGYLIDAPVQGASYTTSSGLGGTTAIDGSFEYASGDSVSFSVLGIPLGSAVQVPGSGVITPATITNAAATSPAATALAQFLQTLSQVGVYLGTGAATGNLVMPGASDASTLQTALAGLGTSNIPTIVGELQGILDTTFGANAVTVVPATTASAALQTAIQATTSAAADAAEVNTVWTITCSANCGTASIVLLANGTVAGAKSDGGIVFGTWTVDSGAITLQLGSASGGTASGTLPAGQTSCAGCVAITQKSGSPATGSLSEVTASGGTATITDSGLWYFFVSPTASGTSDGVSSTLGIMIAQPDGSLVVTDGGANLLSGSWSANSFSAGPANGTTSGNDFSISGSFASSNGQVTSGGATVGSISISRTPPPLTSVGAPITINWSNSFTGAGGSPPGGCGDCNPGVILLLTGGAGTQSIELQYTNPFDDGNGGSPGQGTPTTLSSTLTDALVPAGTYSYTVSIDATGGTQTSQPASDACTVSAGASGTFTTSASQSQVTLGRITVTCAN